MLTEEKPKSRLLAFVKKTLETPVPMYILVIGVTATALYCGHRTTMVFNMTSPVPQEILIKSLSSLYEHIK